jgi:hypothetical protein
LGGDEDHRRTGYCERDDDTEQRGEVGGTNSEEETPEEVEQADGGEPVEKRRGVEVEFLNGGAIRDGLAVLQQFLGGREARSAAGGPGTVVLQDAIAV